MQTHEKLCIGWLHGLGVSALHSKAPCSYSVCNPTLFDETRLSTLCRDDLAFDFRPSPDGSADDLEVGHKNIINITQIDESHLKTEFVALGDVSGSGSYKTGSENQPQPSKDSDPIGYPDTHENTSLTPASIRGPVASESRGELLQCEAEISTLEDLLRHYWLLRDSEEEIQKTISRREPAHGKNFNCLLKPSHNDSAGLESSSTEAGDEGDNEKDEIRSERDDTDSLASLSTISEEDPEEISSADSSNRIDALFGDPDRQDFRRFYQHPRPSFGARNVAEISTNVDESVKNELANSRDYEDSWESLEDGEEGGEEHGGGGNPISDSEKESAVPPPSSADDTFARIFSRHVTDTCPSFSPDFVSQDSDDEDDDECSAPGTVDDPKDTEANSQTNNDEYTISDTRVHLNLIACQDDHEATDGCLDDNSRTDVVAGRSSLISSPASWYTVSDVFDSQSFETAEIADNGAEGDITMSAAYAKCMAIYRCAAADSSAPDSPPTCFSVSTKVTAVDPVTALSRAASRAASLAAAKACPVLSARSQGSLEISLTASCSLSPSRGDVDNILTDGANDANDVDPCQALDTVDNSHLSQALDTVDSAEPRCYSIEAHLLDQKPRFISMIDSATETIHSVADAAVQSDIASFSNTDYSFPASTLTWSLTRKDALTGDDTIEDIVFEQNSAEVGNNFSCQIALPSMKICDGPKSSGYGSRSSSDDLLDEPDDYEITGIAVKEFPKFKTLMPQNSDTGNKLEEFGQELPTRMIEVNYSDQEERRHAGKGQDTFGLNDRSNENRISGQEPLFGNNPTNNYTSEKIVNGNYSNFVHKNDAVIPSDGDNDAGVVIHADLRQAFGNAEPRCCSNEADLSDHKNRTEKGGYLDNKDNFCVRGSTAEDKMRYKNQRESIGFADKTVASSDYALRRDTWRVSSPVIRSKSLLLETDIDTLEHRRTIVARNCSTSSVGDSVTNRTHLPSTESQKQRRSNKSKDHLAWDSKSSSFSSFDLASKEALEFMLCDDSSPPRHFAKERFNSRGSDSHKGGGYYNSEPNLKPNVNKRNTSPRNSSKISIGKDILGARKIPDKTWLETRDEITLHRDSVDRVRSLVSTDHHHDGKTRNSIERYDDSPSLRRRSLSILTTPSSGIRKKSDVTPELPRPVNSSFENLVDSLLGITAVMSMETAARFGSKTSFVGSKGGGNHRGKQRSKDQIPHSSERRTFAKPSPLEKETNGDQGRTNSGPSPLAPLSASLDPAQTTSKRSLPPVRKHEHFRKAKHIFLKCGGFCIEGNGASTRAKGKAPVALR